MPWKEKTIEKLYWSIGEVAEQLGVNTSLIRYWEKEFGKLAPKAHRQRRSALHDARTSNSCSASSTW
jgi:hypothetical protein